MNHRVICLLYLFPFLADGTLTQTRIKLNPLTGGYENISVIVSSELPPEKCPQILDKIKFSLTEASRSLHQSLDERVFFGLINIVVPESWTASHCQTPLSDAHPISSKRPDIIIGVDHPIKKNDPWTQQSLGCSQPGDFIYIPHTFLKHNRTGSASTHRRMAQEIRDQWLKYRYGVFSSIDSDNYNSITSTHHALCQGISVRNVIRGHSDMIGHNSKKEFVSPVFRISRHASPKYVLVVENSKAMNDGHHWNFIRTALKKLLKKDFPDYVRIGLVLFNDGAHILHTVEFLKNSRDDISRLIPREYSLSPNRGSCIRCGVIKAIEALQTTGTTVGASLIILSQGKSTGLSNLELKELLHLGVKHRLQMFSISVTTSHPTDISLNMELLAHKTGGLSFIITDESGSKRPSFKTYVDLVESFREIQTRTTDNGPYLIHEKDCKPFDGSVRFESGSFVIDKFIGNATSFSVFAMHPAYSKNGHIKSISIQDRRGDISKTLADDQESFNILSLHNVHFREEQNIGMNWTYSLERIPSDTNENAHFVLVTSRPRVKDEDIKVTFFTNVDEHSFRVSPENPVQLFAEVKLNQVPVMDASVVVEIRAINQSGYLMSPIRIRLLDNGNGDPDVQINDGIYSRYLTDFSGGEGRYTITVFVDDNEGRAFSFQRENNPKVYYCCNRKEEEYNILNMKLGTFSRIIKGNSFRIPYILYNGADVIPPSRILDLKVEAIADSQELEFSWTAPGDDYDSGKVTSYRLHSCKMAEELYINLNRTRVVDGFTASKEAGDIENHKIKIEELDTTMYYALVAVDESGNVGLVSNIKKGFIASPLAVIGHNEHIMDKDSSILDGKTISQGHHLFRGVVEPDKALLYIVIGIAGFIVICIILILIIVFSYRRKKIIHSDRELSSVNSVIGDTMRSMGVSTGRSEESTHSPGYSVVCDEHDLIRNIDTETKGFLESSAVVVNSSSSTQFSNGKYENQLAPRENTYGYIGGTYGWTELHNPYVTSNTLPSYREYQNTYVPNYENPSRDPKSNIPMYAKPIPKSERIPTSFSDTFGLPTANSSSTTNTLLLSQPSTPTKNSEEITITRGMTALNTPAITKEKKSILKKPKAIEEELRSGGGASSTSSSCTSKDQIERSSQSSQVSFSDQDNNSGKENPSPDQINLCPPSPSDNIYLETSFEYQEQQEALKKLNPPSLSAVSSYINIGEAPLIPSSTSAALSFSNTSSLVVCNDSSNLDNFDNTLTLDKRIRNITQV
ncbi:calcium-activated chloride channel regulator 1 [Lepeophtheirus salmonis]|uniref:calcium-activated chloride channel regulator 1 n=1 Tax=Lepeophtheirus salmonis TaxID=72036 RepID=UPI001AEB0963|nr:calcium-activated chloride channel regulator 2-like [Lepeophtheirus salmonis]